VRTSSLRVSDNAPNCRALANNASRGRRFILAQGRPGCSSSGAA
jgi:hypothetical protein